MTIQGTNGCTLYIGNKIRGSVTTKFAKCTCGAEMVGQEAIDEHRGLPIAS
jgi:hypothetical protein